MKFPQLDSDLDVGFDRLPCSVQEGDQMLLRTYAPNEGEIDGKEILFICDLDIRAKWRGL